MATENEATPVDLEINDAELFSEAMADTPAEPAVEAEQASAESEAQARDDKGRFAAKEEKTEAEPEPTAEQRKVEDEDRHGQIPSWRLREEREARAEAQKQLESERAERAKLAAQLELMQRQPALAQQPKPAEQPREQRPDPLIDPEGYERYMENKFEQRLLTERRELSLAQAHRTYKKDFDEAYASAQEAMAKGDAALIARMQRSRDPGETLIEWHREQKVMREVGNDPNAFFEKRLESYLSDPANLAKVMEKARGTAANTQTQRPNVQLPPSLASMSRADSSRGGADDTDISDEGLFGYAIR